MKYATVTPRDLLLIDSNPARIPLAVICERFGVHRKVASELRQLATRAPSVLAEQAKRMRREGGA